LGVLSGRLGVLDLSWLGLKLNKTAGSAVEVKEVEEADEEEEEEEERGHETEGRARKGRLEMF
jgi:hypothetical protein